MIISLKKPRTPLAVATPIMRVLGAILITAGCTVKVPPPSPSPVPSDISAHPTATPSWTRLNGKGIIYIGERLNSEPGRTGTAFSGFDDALAKFLAGKLGYDDAHIERVDVTAATREKKLKEGKVQLVVATYTISPLREADVDFAGSYMVSDQGVMVRKRDEYRVASSADLPNNKIHPKLCTTKGSVQATDPAVNSDSTATYPQQCAEKVKTGEMFAFYSDLIVLQLVAKEYPDLSVVSVSDLGQRGYFGVGVQKRSPDCKRVAGYVREYLTQQWALDFKQYFSDVVRQSSDFESIYKPAASLSDQYTHCEATV